MTFLAVGSRRPLPFVWGGASPIPLQPTVSPWPGRDNAVGVVPPEFYVYIPIPLPSPRRKSPCDEDEGRLYWLSHPTPPQWEFPSPWDPRATETVSTIRAARAMGPLHAALKTRNAHVGSTCVCRERPVFSTGRLSTPVPNGARLSREYQASPVELCVVGTRGGLDEEPGECSRDYSYLFPRQALVGGRCGTPVWSTAPLSWSTLPHFILCLSTCRPGGCWDIVKHLSSRGLAGFISLHCSSGHCLDIASCC